MQQIRRAVDESKQQFVVNHGDEQRRIRESAIAARAGANLQDGKQYHNPASPGGPEPKKPVAGAPKGIPMTMIVSQPADQDGVFSSVPTIDPVISHTTLRVCRWPSPVHSRRAPRKRSETESCRNQTSNIACASQDRGFS